jgi:hypothetical protein
MMHKYSIFYRGRFVGLVDASDSATALMLAEATFGKASPNYVARIVQ